MQVIFYCLFQREAEILQYNAIEILQVAISTLNMTKKTKKDIKQIKLSVLIKSISDEYKILVINCKWRICFKTAGIFYVLNDISFDKWNKANKK